MAVHWIGAGANLITGSDRTTRDILGSMLKYDDEEATALAAFTATYPMQPRNPTGSPTVGGSDALQLRAWTRRYRAGVVGEPWLRLLPPPSAEAPVSLWGPVPTEGSAQLVTIPLTALGIGTGMENGAEAWDVRRVGGGGGGGGTDHTDVGNWTDTADCNLDPGRACFTCLRKWVVESHVDVSLRIRN